MLSPRRKFRLLGAAVVLVSAFYTYALKHHERIEKQTGVHVSENLPLDVLAFVVIRLPTLAVKRLLGLPTANPHWTFIEEFLMRLFHFFAKRCGDSALRNVVGFYSNVNRALAYPVYGLCVKDVPQSAIGFGKGSSGEEKFGAQYACTAVFVTLTPQVQLDASTKVILFTHGGGFTFGHPMMYPAAFAKLLQSITKRGMKNVGILSVDYPLSPMAKHPIPIETCLYVYDNVKRIVPPENLIPMGDSAGGNIATNMGIHATKYGAAGVVLISPWIGHTHDTVSHEENAAIDFIGGHDLLEKNSRLMFRESRLDLAASARAISGADSKLHLVTHEKLSVLPPVYISAGESEVFRDDIFTFNKHLQELGVDTEMHVGRHAPHIYPLLWPLFAPTSTVALDEMAAFCYKRFNAAEAHLKVFRLSVGAEEEEETFPGSPLNERAKLDRAASLSMAVTSSTIVIEGEEGNLSF